MTRRLLSLVLLVGLGGQGNAASLIIFGDSLSDTGTISFVLETAGQPSETPPPYFDGRFSNGPLYVEQLGFAVTPALLGGTNYAVGGARTTSHVGGPVLRGLSLEGQLEFFTTNSGGVADPTDIYLVWIGANDVRQGVLGGDRGAAEILVDNGLAALELALLDLRTMGAERIIVPNVPDIGRTPQFSADPTSSTLGTDLSIRWNNGLEEIVTGLRDPQVELFDVFGILNELIADPGAHGITNTRDSALLNLDQNPDEFVFWDDIHPTARTHELLADELRPLIPEPNMCLLVGLGSVLLLGRSRRDRSRLPTLTSS